MFVVAYTMVSLKESNNVTAYAFDDGSSIAPGQSAIHASVKIRRQASQSKHNSTK
jgi:hypothetical protein